MLQLSRDLGVPVVPTAARTRRGLTALIQAIDDVATGKITCQPYHFKTSSAVLNQTTAQLVRKIQAAYPDLPNARWVALRLLDGDERIAEAIRKGELGEISLAVAS